MGLTELVTSLGDNAYFGAGFGLAGVGALAAVSRKASQFSLILFRRYYMTTVEVTCKDKSFDWLLHWLTRRGDKGHKTQHLTVETSFKEADSGKIMTKYDYQPSVGTHFMKFNRTWVKVERTRENRLSEPWETVQLTTLGKNTDLFNEILEDARTLALEEFSGKTVMYTCIGLEWKPFGHPRQPRPLNSVVLKEGLSDTIANDVKDFIHNPDWYRARGIPYRRGYLLHGPPGCGKTSYITALAGELQYSICVLNLSDRSMSDDRLAHRLADAPENSIILLEDVDAVFVSRDDAKTKMNENAYQGLNRLTLSGLLNAIDGVTSTEGRILFMTTNYADRLDPALIRPGRVDRKVFIGHCDHYQLKQMFSRFYPDAKEELVNEFADKVIGLESPVSAAQIQGFFMFSKDNPQDIIDNVNELKPQEFNTDSSA